MSGTKHHYDFKDVLYALLQNRALMKFNAGLRMMNQEKKVLC